MTETVALAGALAFTWLLWSGIFDNPLLLVFGVVSVLGVLWLSRRMQIVDDEGVPLSVQTLGLLTYVPWLVWQVVTSNLDVARRIWSRTPVLAPRFLQVEPTQRSFVGRVLYANSITLTPGTVSVRMYDGEILVHALHEGTAGDVEDGDMDRRITALERGP